MAGLPKSIIKKYGVTKKAWRVYKSRKRRPRTTRRVKRKVRRPMARRRRRRRRYPRIRRYVRRRGGTLSMKNLAIGAAIVSVVEPTLDTFLDQMIPISVAGIDPKDFGKTAIGWYLLKKKGTVKGIGAALMIIGVRNIVRGFTGGIAVGTSASTGW